MWDDPKCVLCTRVNNGGGGGGHKRVAATSDTEPNERHELIAHLLACVGCIIGGRSLVVVSADVAQRVQLVIA